MEPVTLIAWSDYLCPWCFNATVRLQRIEEEFGPDVRVEWRSYLLRPNPRTRGDLERFRAYTRSWERPAAEPDAGDFRVWQGDAGPPSHSVPPHLLAKAAATLGPDAFRSMHLRLMRAYFSENRDVTDDAVQRDLWLELGLPEAELARREDPALLEQVLDEHAAAQEAGATGVPAVKLQGNDAIIVGAHPLELYRRWMTRLLAARDAGEAAGA